VYKDVKPQDFYIDRQGMYLIELSSYTSKYLIDHLVGRPSKMMYESLVYNLVLNKYDPNIPPLPEGEISYLVFPSLLLTCIYVIDTYTEVHTSPNRMVRIYKVSHRVVLITYPM
jgi:hypothetical protein